MDKKQDGVVCFDVSCDKRLSVVAKSCLRKNALNSRSRRSQISILLSKHFPVWTYLYDVTTIVSVLTPTP